MKERWQDKIKIVIFDSDRTTLDFEKTDREVCSYILNKYGNNFLFEQVYMKFERVGQYMKNHSIVSTSMIIFKLRVILQGIFLSPFHIKSFFDEYMKVYLSKIQLMNNAKKIVKLIEARGYTTLIVSNNYFNEDVVKRDLDVKDYYPKNIFEGKKRIYHEILKEYHVLPEEVLVVGDNLFDDILAPSKIGMKTCWFNGDKIKKPIIHKFTIADLEIYELEELLDQI